MQHRTTRLLLLVLFTAGLVRLGAQSSTTIFRSPLAADNFTWHSLASAADGGWYAAGSGVGDFQVVVARFDPNGNVLWAKMPDGRRGINTLVGLPDGGVLVFGNNEEVFSYFDASLLHLDPDGNVVSERIWGTEGGLEYWNDAKTLANGDILATATVNDENTFEGFTLLVRTSPTGDVLGEQLLSANTGSTFGKILPLPDGGFYSLGGGAGFGVTLARFAADATPLWAWAYDLNAGETNVFTGTVLSNGSLFLVGNEYINGFSDANLFVFRADEEGFPLEQASFDATVGLNPIEVFEVGPDSVLVTAAYDNQFWPPVDNDNLQVLLDASANLRSASTFGSDTRDFPFGSLLHNGQLIWAGMTTEQSDLDSTLGYLTRSPLLADSDCPKTGTIGEKNVLNLDPILSPILFEEIPNLTFFESPATLSDLPLTSTVVCGTVSAPDLANPCALPAAAYLPTTCAAVQAVATGDTYLQVFNATGQLVLRRKNPGLHDTEPQQMRLQPGIYWYNLEFEACGAPQSLTGKMVVVE